MGQVIPMRRSPGLAMDVSGNAKHAYLIKTIPYFAGSINGPIPATNYYGSYTYSPYQTTWGMIDEFDPTVYLKSLGLTVVSSLGSGSDTWYHAIGNVTRDQMSTLANNSGGKILAVDEVDLTASPTYIANYPGTVRDAHGVKDATLLILMKPGTPVTLAVSEIVQYINNTYLSSIPTPGMYVDPAYVPYQQWDIAQIDSPSLNSLVGIYPSKDIPDLYAVVLDKPTVHSRSLWYFSQTAMPAVSKYPDMVKVQPYWVTEYGMPMITPDGTQATSTVAVTVTPTASSSTPTATPTATATATPSATPSATAQSTTVQSQPTSNSGSILYDFVTTFDPSIMEGNQVGVTPGVTAQPGSSIALASSTQPSATTAPTGSNTPAGSTPVAANPSGTVSAATGEVTPDNVPTDTIDVHKSDNNKTLMIVGGLGIAALLYFMFSSKTAKVVQ